MDERCRQKRKDEGEAAIDHLPAQGLTQNWVIVRVVEVLMENDTENDNQNDQRY